MNKTPREIIKEMEEQITKIFNSIGIYSPSEDNYFVAVNEILRKKADRPEKIGFRLETIKSENKIIIIPHNLYTTLLCYPFVTNLKYDDVKDKTEYEVEGWGTISLQNNIPMIKTTAPLDYMNITLSIN